MSNQEHLFVPGLDDFGPEEPVAAPFKTFSFPGVYALFGADGECIYVGQSVSIPARLKQHKSKPWWSKVQMRRTLTLADEESRLLRETVLILYCRPRANRAIKLCKRKDGSWFEAQFLRFK
jgi:hypothetical protein